MTLADEHVFFSHDIYSDLDCAFVVFENGAHFEIDVCAVDADVDDDICPEV